MSNEIDFVVVVFVGSPLMYGTSFMHSDPDGKPKVEIKPGRVSVSMKVEPCGWETTVHDDWIRAAIAAAKKEHPELQFDPSLPQ